jgi:hypothetical protein
MRLIIFVVLSAVTVTVFSQKLTYTKDDFGNIGDEYWSLKQVYDTNSMPILDDIDATGWDFSSIIPQDTSHVNIISPDDIGDFPDIPDGTMALKTDSSNFSFVKFYADTLMIIGIYYKTADTAFVFMLPEPLPMIKFPLIVGENMQKTSSFSIYGTSDEFGIELQGVDSLRFDVNITYSSNVEAIGNLKTFKNTYETFKVIATNVFNTDGYIKVPYVGWVLYKEDILKSSGKSFQYFTPEYGLPVCSVNLTSDNKISQYEIINNNTSNVYFSYKRNFTFYPNPIHKGGIIYFIDYINEVSIYNLQGFLIKAQKNISSIRLDNLSKGIYIISGVSINGKFFDKLIVR